MAICVFSGRCTDVCGSIVWVLTGQEFKIWVTIKSLAWLQTFEFHWSTWPPAPFSSAQKWYCTVALINLPIIPVVHLYNQAQRVLLQLLPQLKYKKYIYIYNTYANPIFKTLNDMHCHIYKLYNAHKKYNLLDERLLQTWKRIQMYSVKMYWLV